MSKELADRMLVAADTVAEASRLYEAFDPNRYEWSAERLRAEAVHVAAEAGEDVRCIAQTRAPLTGLPLTCTLSPGHRAEHVSAEGWRWLV